MSETEVIHKYAEAFNNRDLDALAELFAEEAELPIRGVTSKEAIRAWLRSLLISVGDRAEMHTGVMESRPAMYTQFPGLHGDPERQGYGTVRLTPDGRIAALEWADDPVNAWEVRQ